MKTVWRMAATLLCVCSAGLAQASEAEFLKSLQGKWTGGGPVRIRINWIPVTVSCKFDTAADDTALSMKGTCRGMMLMSRSISADIRANGAKYSGWYIGPKGGKASLNGSRNGDAIDLVIHWPKIINGDRIADLTVQRVGDNGMKLITTDIDPASGQKVVTSELSLTRK